VKTKTAYRPKNIPAEETPAPSDDQEIIQPSASTTINFDTNKTDPPVAVVAVDPDEAALALQNQLAHLKKSEDLQRQYAAQLARQRPPSREEKLSAWRAQGAEESELSFLEQNPELIDRPDVTSQAAAAALHAGLQRGTDEFNNAVKLNFDTLLGRAEAQAQAGERFFQPRPVPATEPPGPAAFVSAPVSRREAGGPRELSPRSVKLSPLEQEMARNVGISDAEYAKQKLVMMARKANGEIPQ
jgi:hypothetical protein